ncbi:hypothetical protein E8E95_02980 [Pseudomonas sp. BN414]|uniref:hypothetical protein n=1 Tax=Pseudomonas sp. BN414 TaxID=2567888 RepID=UPI00245421CE|nr:hypothetical protein [Pseudomonas sp. BN414]MDH4565636.1 hypothetical protein [Pseudomonas sp. BN414]
MANQDLLNRVYATISALHKGGRKKLSVMEVAKLSGVARATINQKHDPDWVKVREAIKGTFHSGSDAEDSSAVLEQPLKSTQEIHQRLKEFEEQLALLRERANTTYNQLIDRLQYYFALTSEKPAKQMEKAKLLQELTHQKNQNAILRADLKAALAESLTPAVSGIITSKSILEVPNTLSEPEAILDFLEKLDSLSNRSSLVTTVYILCGLPMCGKSSWIENHKPPTPGVSLYVSGASETASIRNLLASRVRKAFNVPVHCVRFRIGLDACISRAEKQFNGAVLELNISLIKSVAARFEEIQFIENFDSIILA